MQNFSAKSDDKLPPGYIPLAELPQALRELTGAEPASYRRLYEAVLNDQLRTLRFRGRHYVAKSRMPAIAAMFAPHDPGTIAA